MYKYIQNSLSQTKIDEQLTNKIHAELIKHHIDSEFLSFSSEKELTNLLNSIDKVSTSTLVIIGDDNDFNILIGLIGKLGADPAIGYLPIAKSAVAKALQIHNYLDAAQALAQRKIIEKTIYSISSRYFYDEIHLHTEPNGTGTKDNSMKIKTETGLELSLPASSLKFENLNEDRYLNDTPIQINAYSPANNILHSKGLKAKIINILIKNPQPLGKSMLNLHAKMFKIESTNNLVDNLGRKYKNTLIIGKHNSKIRLIAKKLTKKAN
ncbi:hypothetical protein EXS66_00260 [Candidatus Saccharibacteria bacterium]|nr:hypothetical protein [Candidatus Saccharibacteria bacterium]